jgi:hypothetical protein
VAPLVGVISTYIIMQRSLIYIFSVLILFSCTRIKYSEIKLPLTKDTPVLLENNDGVSFNTQLVEEKNSTQLLGTHNLDLNNYQATIYQYNYNVKNNHFSEPTPLLPKPSKLNRVYNGAVRSNKVTWIYYSEANNLKDTANNFRANLKDNKLINIQRVNLKKQLRLIFWQKYYSLPNGNIVMVYRSGKGMFFSKSKDGVNFEEPIQITKFRSSMPFFLALTDEHYMFSFQNAGHRKGAMKTNFVYSDDSGKTWSDSIVLSPPETNAHDTYLFKRLDGKVDAYYIFPIGKWRGFSLFRRCIKSDYSLGDNQLIIEKEFGNLAKPSVFRLHNDEILLTFINQANKYNLYSTKIYGDSSCD